MFSGPAINVLAIVYWAKLLGYDIGLGRAIGAIFFSVVVGLIMAFIYRKEKSAADARAFAILTADPNGKSLWLQILFIGSLVGVRVFAASQNWIVMGAFLAAMAVILWRWRCCWPVLPSLPAMFTLTKIMSFKKMITYVGVVVVMATITGYIFGFIPNKE